MAKKVQTVVVESDVEVISKPGLGLDEGIVLTTFFLLVGAIALVVIANNAYTAAAG